MMNLGIVRNNGSPFIKSINGVKITSKILKVDKLIAAVSLKEHFKLFRKVARSISNRMIFRKSKYIHLNYNLISKIKRLVKVSGLLNLILKLRIREISWKLLLAHRATEITNNQKISLKFILKLLLKNFKKWANN